jgi:hypothetical protein
MNTSFGHLTYCTNIHPGENWEEHFEALKQHIPAIKAAVSPDRSFGIGLRISNKASLALSKEENLQAFKNWLQEVDCYVFTINGFPYGGFHGVVVKDQVHTPDWATAERVAYTIRLFRILASLLPAGMDGGISTSPLSYKHWHRCETEVQSILESATLNMLFVLEQLILIHQKGGPLLHLDIEPEPDGLLESAAEYVEWYVHQLLPVGTAFLQEKCGMEAAEAVQAIKRHIQLCYDVCHMAVSYEAPKQVLELLQAYNLKVGKLQISAALKAHFDTDVQRKEALETFQKFNESVYLHQVVAQTKDGTLEHYPDLPQAFEQGNRPEVQAWRAHFHVPLFAAGFDTLQSTRDDIVTILQIQQQQPFTNHLEIETYTWDVLPDRLKIPLTDSIVRELQWVQNEWASI